MSAAPAAYRYYRPELDALRFGAFLGTFLFHRMDFVPTDPVKDVWAWRIETAGAFGVPIFFVLSSFLIAELLLREYDRFGTLHIWSFYVRRMLRIWPLYFVELYSLVLLDHVIPGVGARNPEALLSFTLFAGNWWVTFKGWIAGPVDPLWSISVEEQFYIIVPLVIAIGGRKTLMLESVAALVTSYAVIGFYAAHKSPGDHGEWTNSFVQFQFFGAGTISAVLLRGRMPRAQSWLRGAGILAGLAFWLIAICVFSVRSWDPKPTLPGAIAGWLLVLTGTIVIFMCLLGIEKARIPRWLSYFGRISYGLYIFHSLIMFLVFTYLVPNFLFRIGAPMGQALGTALSLICSLAVAHFSFVHFERPILQLKSRFTYVPAREESAS